MIERPESKGHYWCIYKEQWLCDHCGEIYGRNAEEFCHASETKPEPDPTISITAEEARKLRKEHAGYKKLKTLSFKYIREAAEEGDTAIYLHTMDYTVDVCNKLTDELEALGYKTEVTLYHMYISWWKEEG